MMMPDNDLTDFLRLRSRGPSSIGKSKFGIQRSMTIALKYLFFSGINKHFKQWKLLKGKMIFRLLLALYCFTFCVAIAVMNTWKNGDSKFLKFDIM